MAQTNVVIEMNEKLKNQFDTICEDLGMDAETAMNIFAQKMVNEQQMPFEITAKDYPVDEDELRKERMKKILASAAIGAGIGFTLSMVIRLSAHFARKNK